MFLMKRAGRHLLCLSLAGVCVVAASGCGNDGNEVPADAVAKVGDTVITKEQFDHAYANAAKVEAEAQQGGLAVVPDPPKYTKCLATLNKAVAKMEHPPQVYEREVYCKESYKRLKTQAMQFLIQSQWVLQEAEDQDLTATDAEIRKAFEEQKKSFPKEKDYRKFLASSGGSEQDVLFRLKLNLLQGKLAAAIQKDQEAQQDFYTDFSEKHKKETRCADGFVVDMCSNAPEVRTNTVPVPGISAAPAAPAP